MESLLATRGPKMITQLCRLGWLGSLHVLLYIPCHVLLSQARQTAVMARAKQACEEMHIDWYQPQACRHQSQQCGVVPNWLVPNPMVYIGLPMFAMILISPLNSAILETVPLQGLFLPRLIHIDDDELLYTPQHRKIGELLANCHWNRKFIGCVSCVSSMARTC